MPSLTGSMIPDTIDSVLNFWNQSDGDQLRITLLHRSPEKSYYFITCGTQEFPPAGVVSAGLALNVGKSVDVSCFHELRFGTRIFTTDDKYVFFDHKEIDEGSKIIPFKYTGVLPSRVLGASLSQKVYGHVENLQNRIVYSCERMGDAGFVRATLESFGSAERAWKKAYVAEAASISGDINELFLNEENPSTFIQPSEYLSEDELRDAVFVQKRWWQSPYAKLALLAPLLAILPHTQFMVGVTAKVSENYRLRYGETPEVERERLQGEFALLHPCAAKGVQVMFEASKHAANLFTYGLVCGASYGAYSWLPPWVSYPLLAGTAASGLVMAGNLIASKGHASSGIIATVFEKKKNRLV